jgi:acyl-CoA reductase-like NAD-dependent aldehyde dehydrogenase
MRELQALVGGEWVGSGDVLDVHSPYDGRTVARVARCGERELHRALDAAAQARGATAALPPHRRASILESAAAAVLERREELAQVLVEEAGKPVALARVEAERCAETLREAARVARSPEGQLLDLGGFPSGEGRLGLVRRFPLGVVVGITPFNFPLNLVAHKLAPAVAAGCPIVLKPASQTPSPALLLGHILAAAGVPPGGISVVPCRAAEALPLLTDPRVRLVTFTGSAQVGWELKRIAWDRRVCLELGGNAAVIVEPDAGDLAAVARRVAAGAYAYAGQSCISVQRVLIHRTIAARFREELVAATEGFPTGDPAQEGVLCGPMISEGDADRIQGWIAEARGAGARLLTREQHRGSVVSPLLVEGVPPSAHLWAAEAFAPVAALAVYDDFAQALAMVNDSRFGLQAGLFTSDLAKLQTAFETLEVGGIIQGDIPSWRTDPMPYGGVKESGVGREGPRWAVEEMTELRLLVLRRD